MKTHLNKYRFAYFILVVGLAVVAIAVIWGLNRKNYSTKSSSNFQSESEKSDKSNNAVESDQIVSVIYEDGSIKSSNISELDNNEDKKAIITTLNKECMANQNGIARVNEVAFTEVNTVYKQEGDYARISAGCGEDKTTNVTEDGGGGFAIYLSKSSEGEWLVDTQTQEEGPDCQYVDGKGYPVSILEECYDSGNLRLPKT